MNYPCLVAIALSACAASVCAQTNEVYRVSVPTPDGKSAVALIDVSDLFEPGMTDTATKVFGYPGKRMGLASVGEPRSFTLSGLDRHSRNNRAWGMSVGLQTGPVTFRVAHQNRNVAKIAPAMPLGNRTDAKNSILAVNLDLGLVKAYTAYSASRGWGSSPLWNPDNPYGAAMATTASTDSRDVLVGLAMPLTREVTLLTSFIRKNDRDLANRDADQFALGGTYAISRKMDFYAAYSHIKMRSGPGAMSGIPISPSGSSALNLGMRHSF